MENSDKTQKKRCERCKKVFDYVLGDDIICIFCGHDYSTEYSKGFYLDKLIAARV